MPSVSAALREAKTASFGWCEKAVASLLLLAVTVAPWWFGAAQPLAGFCLVAVTVAAVVAWLMGLCFDIRMRPRRLPVPVVVIPITLGILVGFAQLWPIPISTLAELSPFAASVRASITPGGAAPVSLDPAATRLQAAWLTVSLLILVLGCRFLASRQALGWLAISLAANAAAMSLVGIITQWTGDARVLFLVTPAEMTTGFGAYVNHSNAAGFLLMGLAGAVGWIVARGRAAGPIAWLITFLIVGGLLASLSRSGCLAAGVAGTTVLLLSSMTPRGRNQARRIGIAVAIAAAVLATALLVPSIGSRLVSIIDRSGRVDQRLEHWSDSIQAAPQFLSTGSGLGSYRYAYLPFEQNRSDEWFYFAENQYLQTLFEMGLPGLVLLMSTLGLVMAAALRLLFTADSRFDRGLALAMTFGLTAQALHAGFDFGLYLPANMAILALGCGAMFGRLLDLQPRLSCSRFIGWHGALRPWLVTPVVCCLFAQSLFPLETLATTAQAAHASHRLRDELNAADSTLERQEAAIVAFVTATEHLESPKSHRRAAQAYIALYRRRAETLLETDEQDRQSQHHIELRKRLADPALLGRFISRRLAAGDRSVLSTFRDDPIVRQTLLPATQHLWLARQQAPLLADVHLQLAELAFLVVDPTEGPNPFLPPLERLAGNREILWYRIGQLAFDAREDQTATRAWHHALTAFSSASASIPSHILDAAESRWTHSHIVDRLLPSKPQLILDVISSRDFDQRSPMRHALMARVSHLLKSSPLEEGQSDFLRGRLESLADRPQVALASFEKAIRSNPVDAQARFELARTLEKLGRPQEAMKHARLCAQLAPAHRDCQRLIGVLRDRLIADRREATP